MFSAKATRSFVCSDPLTKNAIYYEYSKDYSDKCIPYSVVSINRDRNRWWGPSYRNGFTLFKSSSTNSLTHRLSATR